MVVEVGVVLALLFTALCVEWKGGKTGSWECDV